MLKKEIYDKLKQNDRIEYLLRLNRLEKKTEHLDFNWLGLTYFLFAIMGFIILLALQFKILGYEESFISLLKTLKPITTIIFIFILSGFLWNFICELFIFKKWNKELDSEFEIKIKR